MKGGVKLELWELDPASKNLEKVKDLGVRKGPVRASINVLKGTKLVLVNGKAVEALELGL